MYIRLESAFNIQAKGDVENKASNVPHWLELQIGRNHVLKYST